MATYKDRAESATRKTARPDADAPINLEAERIVLATILADNRASDIIADRLARDDFSDPLHQQIFGATLRLIAKGKRAEPASIMSELTAASPMADMNAAAYAEKLKYNARPADQLAAFIDAVRNAAIGRRVRVMCAKYDALATTGADGIVERMSRDVTELTGNMASDTYGHVSDGIDAIMADIKARKAAGGGISGLATGYSRLDDLIDGLAPARLYVIAARPKQGKSALAACIMRNLLRRGTEVCFFSIEMPRREIQQRLIALEAGVSFEALVRGDLSDDQELAAQDAAFEVHRWPLHIDSATGLTPSALALRARHAVNVDGAKAVFIDYLQMIKAERGGSRYEQVTEASMAVAALRKTLNVPIVAMAQLNRKTVDRSSFNSFADFKPESLRPNDADLRDSGQIEQDSDVLMFLNRPETVLEKLRPADGSIDYKYEELCMKWRGRAELAVHFNRGGPTGMVDLRFTGEQMRFDEPARR